MATPPVQQPEASKYNHPCGDLLDGEDYIKIAVPLYRASIAGDWNELTRLIKHNDYVREKKIKHNDLLLRYSITKNKETALHIAAMGQSTRFLEQIVNQMSKDDMALQNGDGNTPLCLAAISGNVGVAKIILEKYPSMLTTRGDEDMMPLCLAALHGNHDMVTFLYHKLQFPLGSAWSDNDWYQIFLRCIEADFFDVALEILNDHKNSVLTLQDKRCVGMVLLLLAQKPNAFHDIPPPNAINYHISQNPIIKRILNSAPDVDIQPSEATQLLKRILEQIVIDLGHDIDAIFGDSYKILFAAAEIGNAKFLIELFHLFPDLIWKINDKRQTIFHIAVKYRHKSIYSLLYEIGSMKHMITRHIDNDGNNMLHLAAKLGESKSLEGFGGAAFQMQHEMLWFKEVEGMVPPSYKNMKNQDCLTPHELFTEQHKDLCHDGEKWIKSTINQSMVAAALISTIGFSVAFSIPGGYNQNNGFPMFHRSAAFITYVVFDAISFILSSVSIMMFLSIMTSGFSQEDFLKSLPQKWVVGQAFLLQSIMTMMATFGASFFVTFHNKLPILIALLTYLAVVIMTLEQYPLMVKALRSFYEPRNLFKPKRRMLYYKNPRF